ncbi:MAG: nickel/cobalt efflux protein RcnA [Tagaea sp. CACIAM 22H2]|nr:nickel/cobalt efflux protein RcnA [Tagaea sp. CACIAM 22H2]
MTGLPDIGQAIASGAANPWLLLPIAALLGALHAMEPGHSKSLMASFMVATRGDGVDAMLLGVSAALSHTLIVWGIAIAALTLGDNLIEERLVPWLALASGLIALALAAYLLLRIDSAHGAHHGHHHHGRGHHHHGGDALPTGRVGRGAVIWFGLTGGLTPCPSAVAVLLLCLQIKALALGVAFVGAFSVGIAATLVAVGLAAAWGAARLDGKFDAFARWAPIASALLIAAAGLWITANALTTLGML